MARGWILIVLLLGGIAAAAQQPKPQDPPEEDESFKEKEYGFNPLQAEKELKIGNFYFKKGNYRAAAGRFEEATKWNPGFAEGWLRLAEAQEKLNDKAARDSYAKFVELAPDDKKAAEIKKKKLSGKP